MALTFTEEELAKLEEAICKSQAKRSYYSHKRDIKNFLLGYFEKLSDKALEKVDPKVDPKVDQKNNLKNYQITKVSKGYSYPSSIYKKDSPSEAGVSAHKGIMKKNNLDKNSSFTFYLKNGDESFKFTVQKGKLINL